MLSEVSYCSRMAEEARAFAQALTAQVHSSQLFTI